MSAALVVTLMIAAGAAWRLGVRLRRARDVIEQARAALLVDDDRAAFELLTAALVDADARPDLDVRSIRLVGQV